MRRENGRLVFINPRDGQTVWTASAVVSLGPVAALACDRQRLFVASEAGNVTALDRGDGHALWTTRTAAGMALGFCVSGPLVYCDAEDGFLYALQKENGHLRFRAPLGDPLIDRPRVTASGLLLASTRAGRSTVTVVDPGSGMARMQLSLVGALASPPLVDGAFAWLALHAGDALLCHRVSLLTGEIHAHTQHRTPATGITLYGGMLVSVASDGQVEARDALTGSLSWTLPGDEGGGDSIETPTPFGHRGLLLIPGAGLRVVDPRTGRIISVVSFDRLSPLEFAHLGNGDVLVSDPERMVALYRLSGHLSRVT